MSKIAPAKLVHQTSYLVHGKLKITEYFFDVPKDYSKPDAGTIRVFARGARKNDVTIIPETSPEKQQLPWLVYLQGGPGMSCPPPQSHTWLQTALDRGYQTLFLDQRGTGLSTPITASTLQMRGASDVQARYLKLYRADSIVRDCEAIRQALTADYPDDKKKWSTLGQSFGGFITLNYLSFHPEGLRECFVFGGLAPLVRNPDEVYRRLYRRTIGRNEKYYAKFPGDVERVRTVMKYLARFGDGKIRLPSDGVLTRRRFAQLGMLLGYVGGLDTVHEIVLGASSDIEAFGHITRKWLSKIDVAPMAFDDNLVFSILHEPIYCQGEAPRWSAYRVLQEYPEFDLDREGPLFFTSEMMYPWMFEDYAELRKVQQVAELVAHDAEWPALYDEAQLARNEVPVYAASYSEDMFLEFDFAMVTARAVRNCRVFTTNVMMHDALRTRTDEVLKQAFELRDDVND